MGKRLDEATAALAPASARARLAALTAAANAWPVPFLAAAHDAAAEEVRAEDARAAAMKAAADGLRAAGDALRISDAAGVRKALAAALSPAAAREVEAVLKGTLRLEKPRAGGVPRDLGPGVVDRPLPGGRLHGGAVFAARGEGPLHGGGGGHGSADRRDPEALGTGGPVRLARGRGGPPWDPGRPYGRRGGAREGEGGAGRAVGMAGGRPARPRIPRGRAAFRRRGFGARRGRRGRNDPRGRRGGCRAWPAGADRARPRGPCRGRGGLRGGAPHGCRCPGRTPGRRPRGLVREERLAGARAALFLGRADEAVSLLGEVRGAEADALRAHAEFLRGRAGGGRGAAQGRRGGEASRPLPGRRRPPCDRPAGCRPPCRPALGRSKATRRNSCPRWPRLSMRPTRGSRVRPVWTLLRDEALKRAPLPASAGQAGGSLSHWVPNILDNRKIFSADGSRSAGAHPVHVPENNMPASPSNRGPGPPSRRQSPMGVRGKPSLRGGLTPPSARAAPMRTSALSSRPAGAARAVSLGVQHLQGL